MCVKKTVVVTNGDRDFPINGKCAQYFTIQFELYFGRKLEYYDNQG